MKVISLFDICCLLNEDQYVSLAVKNSDGSLDYIFNGMICDYRGDFRYNVYALRHSVGGGLKIVLEPED